jgi:SPP1 gp7 family putative phage head morphogenesis protein
MAFQSENFKDFKEKAKEIVDLNRDQWWRVEYDSAERSAVMGESFRKIEEAKDLFPYWQYKTEEDDRVREEHEALDNLIFRIGDPEGDAIFPPCDWNCRCRGEAADEGDIPEGGKISEGKNYLTEDDPETGKPFVAESFRYNPSKQIMPNEGEYFQVFPSANKGNAELFDIE